MPENYYMILGVSPDATQDEIKKAYRRLAKELHPDSHGANHAPFQKINKAYSVLSDPQQRRTYDRHFKPAPKPQRKTPGRAGPPASGPGDPEPLSPFGRNGFHSRRSGSGPPFAGRERFSNFAGAPGGHRPAQYDLTVSITPAQALHGGTMHIEAPLRKTCPRCSGRGGTMLQACRTCRGTGHITGRQPVIIGYPAGTPSGYSIYLPLDRYGLGNSHLRIHFRIRRS